MQKITDDDLLNFMGEQESQYLIKPSDLYDDVVYRLDQEEKNTGDKLPWSKTHKNINLRPSEVSLWAGINSHGKSTLLGQVAAWRMDRKWLIASMEMTPASTVERIVKQISGTAHPSQHYLEKLLCWLDERLWIYDQTDTVQTTRILALVRYASTLGIEHVVIDSLMKCGIGKDNLEGQTNFVDKLCWLAKTNKLHIHLVHHIRKGESENKMPGKFDVRGAGEITDLVDNVFIVFRNKAKEGKPEKAGEPDCYLNVAKQRHHSWEGIYGLWFNRENNQYSGSENYSMYHWYNQNDPNTKQQAIA